MEIGKLGDLHAVEPDFPTEAPGTEGGGFPIVLDKAYVVNQRVDTQSLQGAEVEVLDCQRRRLENYLKLVVMLQAVGVVTVTTVGRAARRLNVGRTPGLRAQRAECSGRMIGASTHLHVEWL